MKNEIEFYVYIYTKDKKTFPTFVFKPHENEERDEGPNRIY